MATMAWSDIQNTVNGEYVPMEEAEIRIRELETLLAEIKSNVQSLSDSINFGPHWSLCMIIEALNRIAIIGENGARARAVVLKSHHDAVVGKLNLIDRARRQACRRLACEVNGETDTAEEMRNSLHWIADAEEEDLL